MNDLSKMRNTFLESMRTELKNIAVLIAIGVLTSLMACKKDDPSDDDTGDDGGVFQCSSSVPIGDDYDLDIPFYAPQTFIPDDNPMKVEAVELGRFLFWDKRLSGDNTMSCGTCHQPPHAFGDAVPTSTGIDGIAGTRNSMPLVNMVFQPVITWDGGKSTLEEQMGEPVVNPIEMHDDWMTVITELESDTMYPSMFEDAFGSPCIDRTRAQKAMAQFVRSMVSFNSRYDRVIYGPETFTPLEQLGLEIWDLEGGDPDIVPFAQGGADCFHCHTLATEIFTDNDFHNNGLDSVFTDSGRGGVTGDPDDMGLFKTPSLRNIEFSGPYMHDGRFQTLEEVVEHYNSGGHPSPTIDPFMKFTSGGLFLDDEKKAALIAFMKTLSDPDFLNNPDYQDPFD